jgi:hypothetical protein
MAEPNAICDYIEPIKAWRVFTFDGRRLMSLNGWVWRESTLRAQCMPVKKPIIFYIHRTLFHSMPDEKCSCGVYSLKSPWPECVEWGIRDVFPLMLISEVEIWGDVVIHEKGYRSEFCRILKVYVPAHRIRAMHLSVNSVWDGQIDAMDALKRYDVEVVEYEQLRKVVWDGNNPTIITGLMRLDDYGVVVRRMSPRELSPFIFVPISDSLISCVTETVPFRALELQKSNVGLPDLVANFETEENYVSRCGNRQGEGGGEGRFWSREAYSVSSRLGGIW